MFQFVTFCLLAGLSPCVLTSVPFLVANCCLPSKLKSFCFGNHFGNWLLSLLNLLNMFFQARVPSKFTGRWTRAQVTGNYPYISTLPLESNMRPLGREPSELRVPVHYGGPVCVYGCVCFGSGSQHVHNGQQLQVSIEGEECIYKARVGEEEKLLVEIYLGLIFASVGS